MASGKTPTGIAYPVDGVDKFDPAGDIKQLAESINHILVFATLAEANTWATSNPTSASPGRLAWVSGDAAFYVRVGTAWTRQTLLDKPVGTILETTTATNPGTYLGGTWAAFGKGQVTVGKADSGTFATAGATGGAETVKLTAAQSGTTAHTHPGGANSATGTINATTQVDVPGAISPMVACNGDYTANSEAIVPGVTSAALWARKVTGGFAATSTMRWNAIWKAVTGAATAADAAEAHTNLQPYVVVYKWHRTA